MEFQKGGKLASEILLFVVEGRPIGAVDVAGMFPNKHGIDFLWKVQFVVGIIHQRWRIILEEGSVFQGAKYPAHQA